jgi:hypothetical protein
MRNINGLDGVTGCKDHFPPWEFDEFQVRK